MLGKKRVLYLIVMVVLGAIVYFLPTINARWLHLWWDYDYKLINQTLWCSEDSRTTDPPITTRGFAGRLVVRCYNQNGLTKYPSIATCRKSDGSTTYPDVMTVTQGLNHSSIYWAGALSWKVVMRCSAGTLVGGGPKLSWWD